MAGKLLSITVPKNLSTLMIIFQKILSDFFNANSDIDYEYRIFS